MKTQSSQQVTTNFTTGSVFDPKWPVSARRRRITDWIAGTAVLTIALGSLWIIGGNKGLTGTPENQARVYENPMYVAPIGAEMIDAGSAGTRLSEPVDFTYATPKPERAGR